MGTKNNPGDFDCYANAEPDEPMFVLLARDESAPWLVEAWASGRLHRKCAETPGWMPDAKHMEALACAKAMREWQKSKR